jgi:proline iminopeptidase
VIRHSLLAVVVLTACTPAPPPPDGLWSVNGTELYVRRIGEGEPIIVIHGGPLLEHGYFLPHLAPLAETHQLVFYDQRLSGRSAGTVDSASVRIATYVDDIEGIRRQLGADRVHVMGHSWGGQLALRYALTHGNRVASLILVSPMPPSTELWQAEERELTSRIAPEDQAAVTTMRATPAVAERRPEAIRNLLLLTFRPQFVDRARADQLALMVPADYGERSRQFGFMMPDLANYDLVPDLRRIAARTLVVFGDAEPALALTGRMLADSIPDARLVTIPASGHFTFVEQPEAFMLTIRSFLNDR